MDETPLPAVSRRDALKALGAIATGAGVTVQPLTEHQTDGLELVILRPGKDMDEAEIAALQRAWLEAMRGTAIENVRTVIMPPDVGLELVRGGGGTAGTAREWACGCRTEGARLARDCKRGAADGCFARRAHQDGEVTIEAWGR